MHALGALLMTEFGSGFGRRNNGPLRRDVRGRVGGFFAKPRLERLNCITLYNAFSAGSTTSCFEVEYAKWLIEINDGEPLIADQQVSRG